MILIVFLFYQIYILSIIILFSLLLKNCHSNMFNKAYNKITMTIYAI